MVNLLPSDCLVATFLSLVAQFVKEGLHFISAAPRLFVATRKVRNEVTICIASILRICGPGSVRVDEVLWDECEFGENSAVPSKYC